MTTTKKKRAERWELHAHTSGPYKASPEDASESMGRGKRFAATMAITMREMGVEAKAMYQPA
jgi:hypothetical protein